MKPVAGLGYEDHTPKLIGRLWSVALITGGLGALTWTNILGREPWQLWGLEALLFLAGSYWGVRVRSKLEREHRLAVAVGRLEGESWDHIDVYRHQGGAVDVVASDDDGDR